VPSWRPLYPFLSRIQTIAGRRYHYVDEFTGSDPAGTLLFVHGNPTWSFHWRELIGAWRDRFRCVAVDHLGCGLSERPDSPLRLADHVDNLIALLDRLDVRSVTLVGQDWGGAIGIGALLRRRERFSQVVLFNTGAFRPWFLPWRIRVCRVPFLGRLAVQGGNAFLRAALRMTLARKRSLPRDVRAGYLAGYRGWAGRRAVYDFVQDIPLSAAHPTWQTLQGIEEGLKDLRKLPILLVWGMRDWCFTPDCLEKFCDAWPHAEVHRLWDVGHWVVEDAPEDARTVVEEFLIATSGGAAGAWPEFPALANHVRDAASCGEQTGGLIGVTPADSVRACVRLACVLEATAPKPGNVHPAASFVDLHYQDLVHSAEAISGALQHVMALGVGRSVLGAVRAMRAAVDTNSYLGTILLLAPLACVPPGTPLQRGVQEVLDRLDASHTRHVYEAIRLAQPGGLGTAARGDVQAEVPDVPLTEVMSWGADRDLVARQYANGFDTIFNQVAQPLRELLRGGNPLFDAIVRVHVQLIAAHGDSLIARKCGPEVAREAQARAAEVLRAGPIGSAAYATSLAALDTWLRADGHRRNPGTTADLIAAGLFVLLREGDLDPAEAARVIAKS
jgi:haloalkane dehalogenase